MNQYHHLPEKIRIARSFGNAAQSYDQYAHFQRETAGKLVSSLSPADAEHILDLGSGTGYCAQILSNLFPETAITNIDIAEPMLHFTRNQTRKKSKTSREDWICGDAEELPIRDNCFDLIVSNLTMQWCRNPDQLFLEIFRVMKPGAHACISTLADNTLAELRASWASIDSHIHVNSFLSSAVIHQILAAFPFTEVKIINQSEKVFYDSFQHLCKELKGIGAHNLNAGKPPGLTGKNTLKKLNVSFEKNRIPGKGIPVSYDLVFIYLVK